jgi:redox-sensitive bicupin YhaK (pirin superfamily)
MDYRSIAHILKAEPIDMGGTRVKQALPTTRVDQISPFLLLHHFGPTAVAPGGAAFEVAPHPHRGFEPVTFLYRGGLRHKDSRGNEGILSSGDVQWMTAGRGIIHSERASDTFRESGGILEGVQLWVNLPREYKMVQPRYQNIKAGQIPQITKGEGKVRIKIVAGNYEGQTGPAQSYTPILALQVVVQSGVATSIDLPEHFNAMLYLLSGEMESANGFVYESGTLLHYKQDGASLFIRARKDAELLVLAGAPIDEPVAQWGPYVMNTQTELLEAMRDYQMGKMGFYID